MDSHVSAKRIPRREVLRVLGTAALVSMATACGATPTPTPTKVPPTPTKPSAPTATSVPVAPTATPVPAAPTATPVPPTPTKAPVVASPTPAIPRGGKIVLAGSQEPAQMNRFYTGMGGVWVSAGVQEGLFADDIKGNPQPILADKVPTVENGMVSKDGLTVRYSLKPNITWSDGKPLTSEDLAFTYQAYKESKQAPNTNNAYNNIDTIEIIDPLTIEVRYKKITVDYLAAFSAVLAKHRFDSPAIPKDHPEVRLPTGTGPFKFVSWKAAEEVILERSPNYRVAGKPYLDGITFKFIPDRNAILAALGAGQIDYLHFVTASDAVTLQKLAQEGKIVFESDPAPTQIEFLWFNHGTLGDYTKPHPVLGDKAIRTAFDYAIDRKTIVNEVLGGFAIEVGSPVPAGWASVDRKPVYDPKKAAEILEAAGWKKGSDGIRSKGGVRASLKFSTPTGDRVREQYQQIIQQNMKDVGIELIIDNRPNTVLWGGWEAGGMRQRGTYDIMMSRTGGGTDPHGFLLTLTTARISSEKNPTGDGWAFWSNPEYDKLVEQGGSTLDQAVRKEAYVKAINILIEERVCLPLYANVRGLAYSKRLKGLKFNWWQLEATALFDVADWYVEK